MTDRPRPEPHQVQVGGPRPYTVHVGAGLLSVSDVARAGIPQTRRALIYPADLPGEWLHAAQSCLQPELSIMVPPRDECKTLEVFGRVLSQLASAALPRDSAVVGLGGGAVTDLAGFVAASYLRGVAYYSLPTTLLGMVDAAVGGKTGLNLPEGKNLVGAFYPPSAVWADTSTLATLPPATFREGAAEAYKHGLIADPTLLPQILDPNFGALSPSLAATIAQAIQVKADIVSRDLTEQGERAYLNFGHTLAHALEGYTHQALPHGDAVGYGMHYAALLSRAMNKGKDQAEGSDLTPHTAAFLRYQNPQPLPPALLQPGAFEALWPYMNRDKKADSQGVRFVLLRGLAQPYLARVSEDVLRSELAVWQNDVHSVKGC